MTKKRKILVAVLVPVILFVAFVLVAGYDTTVASQKGELDGAYATVMANISGIVEANPRYVDIAVLGSHDAVTFAVEPDGDMDLHDKDSVLGKIEFISYGFQYRYSKTQTVGLGAQLRQGARFMHIKCTDYHGEWYGTHAHLCGKLEGHIMEVLEYLASDAAKGEIVTLLFQPMYMGDGVTLDSLNEFLDGVRYEGKSLFDYVYLDSADVFDTGTGGTRIGELTYNDLTKNGTEPGVVILERREDGVFESDWEGTGELTAKCFDMDSCADHEWHSSIGSGPLIEKINATSDKLFSSADDNDGKLCVNQTQASLSVAGVGDVVRCVTNWSLLRFAIDYNVLLIENENFDEWLDTMPVFQVDFCTSDHHDFNKRVNELIFNHNQKLVNELLSAE